MSYDGLKLDGKYGMVFEGHLIKYAEYEQIYLKKTTRSTSKTMIEECDEADDKAELLEIIQAHIDKPKTVEPTLSELRLACSANWLDDSGNHAELKARLKEYEATVGSSPPVAQTAGPATSDSPPPAAQTVGPATSDSPPPVLEYCHSRTVGWGLRLMLAVPGIMPKTTANQENCNSPNYAPRIRGLCHQNSPPGDFREF